MKAAITRNFRDFLQYIVTGYDIATGAAPESVRSFTYSPLSSPRAFPVKEKRAIGDKRSPEAMWEDLAKIVNQYLTKDTVLQALYHGIGFTSAGNSSSLFLGDDYRMLLVGYQLLLSTNNQKAIDKEKKFITSEIDASKRRSSFSINFLYDLNTTIHCIQGMKKKAIDEKILISLAENQLQALRVQVNLAQEEYNRFFEKNPKESKYRAERFYGCEPLSNDSVILLHRFSELLKEEDKVGALQKLITMIPRKYGNVGALSEAPDFPAGYDNFLQPREDQYFSREFFHQCCITWYKIEKLQALMGGKNTIDSMLLEINEKCQEIVDQNKMSIYTPTIDLANQIQTLLTQDDFNLIQLQEIEKLVHEEIEKFKKYTYSKVDKALAVFLHRMIHSDLANQENREALVKLAYDYAKSEHKNSPTSIILLDSYNDFFEHVFVRWNRLDDEYSLALINSLINPQLLTLSTTHRNFPWQCDAFAPYNDEYKHLNVRWRQLAYDTLDQSIKQMPHEAEGHDAWYPKIKLNDYPPYMQHYSGYVLMCDFISTWIDLQSDLKKNPKNPLADITLWVIGIIQSRIAAFLGEESQLDWELLFLQSNSKKSFSTWLTEEYAMTYVKYYSYDGLLDFYKSWVNSHFPGAWHIIGGIDQFFRNNEAVLQLPENSVFVEQLTKVKNTILIRLEEITSSKNNQSIADFVGMRALVYAMFSDTDQLSKAFKQEIQVFVDSGLASLKWQIVSADINASSAATERQAAPESIKRFFIESKGKAPWEVLGISADASSEFVKIAFKNMLKDTKARMALGLDSSSEDNTYFRLIINAREIMQDARLLNEACLATENPQRLSDIFIAKSSSKKLAITNGNWTNDSQEVSRCKSKLLFDLAQGCENYKSMVKPSSFKFVIFKRGNILPAALEMIGLHYSELLAYSKKKTNYDTVERDKIGQLFEQMQYALLENNVILALSSSSDRDLNLIIANLVETIGAIQRFSDIDKSEGFSPPRL